MIKTIYLGVCNTKIAILERIIASEKKSMKADTVD